MRASVSVRTGGCFFHEDMVCCKKSIGRRYGVMDDQQNLLNYETIKGAVAGENGQQNEYSG